MLHTPATATRTPFHRLNPETLDGAVLTHLATARREFNRAAKSVRLSAHYLETAAMMMGLAAAKAERAALLRGEEFDLLPGRNPIIDDIMSESMPVPTLDDVAAKVCGDVMRSVGA